MLANYNIICVYIMSCNTLVNAQISCVDNELCLHHVMQYSTQYSCVDDSIVIGHGWMIFVITY